MAADENLGTKADLTTGTAIPPDIDKKQPTPNTVAAPKPEPQELPHQHLAEMRHDPDAIRHLFESGEYTYKRKMRRRDYEKHKVQLQIELLKVQDWVKATGQKVVLLFEGRDAAGKGGTIKRFTEHLNPRVEMLGEPLDRPTLAGCIPSLKQEDDFLPGCLYPVLYLQ